MKLVEKIVLLLGAPYVVKTIDQEEVVYRKLEKGYEFEVSGLKSLTGNCTLYVRADSPNEVVGIYENISVPALKDLLGYYAVKYQNLTSGIRVLREDQTV